MPGKSKRSRIWTYGSNTLISSLFFIGILVFVVLIAERHPWRADYTESGSYTLSEQTLNILKSLEKPISIKAFFATASPEQGKAKDLLDTYCYYDKRITYEFIDPDRQPEVAKRYEIRAYNTLVLEGYDKKQTLQTADEESITNALLKMTRKEEKKIYFLIGHGERAPENSGKEGYSTAQSALQKENYTVLPLNLLQQPKVPPDAAALIVAGPKKPLMTQEIESLKEYLSRGGKIMAFLDPFSDGGLQEFLKSHGILLGNDVIVDKLSRVFGGSYLMPVVTEYGPHKITEGFEVATFYSEARSVRGEDEPPKGIHVEVLASTSDKAWAETDLEMLEQGQASFDEGKDQPGPVPLAVLAEIDTASPKPDESKEAQAKDPLESQKPGEPGVKDKGDSKKALLLVVGDSDFADNTYFGLSGNGDIFLNMVNFMAEEENLITIKPREKEGRPMLLSQSQAQMVLLTVLVFVPLTVLTVGFIVYRVRRSQR